MKKTMDLIAGKEARKFEVECRAGGAGELRVGSESGMFVTSCSHAPMGLLVRVSCRRDAGMSMPSACDKLNTL